MTLEEENLKLKAIIRSLLPSKYDVYFICGENGSKDSMGLPERLFICPSYGLEGMAVYTKTSDYSAPGY